jgi:hypothetical protein
MFILRILLKTALLPVVLIEAGIMGVTIGTGIIESLVDAALMGIAGI